jgi:uncharacterized membrane protein
MEFSHKFCTIILTLIFFFYNWDYSNNHPKIRFVYWKKLYKINKDVVLMSENIEKTLNVKIVNKTNGLGIAAVVLTSIGFAGSWIPIMNIISMIFSGAGIILGLISLIKAFKIKKFVLPILSVILGILTFCISNFMNNKLKESVDQSLDNMNGNNTEQLLKNDVSVELGKFQVIEKDYGLKDTELSVKITNKASSKKSYRVKIEALDQTGIRIEDDTVYADSLNSGQTAEEKAFKLVTSDKIKDLQNATFKILEVSQT